MLPFRNGLSVPDRITSLVCYVQAIPAFEPTVNMKSMPYENDISVTFTDDHMFWQPIVMHIAAVNCDFC